MITLLRREFSVDLPVEQAWAHLARVTEWPRWARHIRSVEMSAGELGPSSSGLFDLGKGIKSRFVMTEFHPHRNWKWAGPFLWLTVHYDHRFEAEGPDRTRLCWVIEAEGFGVSLLGRLFAKIYNRNLDRAIPLLIQEMAEGRE